MTFTRGIAVTALMVTALVVRADDASKKSAFKAGDKQSVIEGTAKMHMATEKFAELANEKAENPQLKQYAQKLAQDHKQSKQELEKLAQKHNVTLPTAVDEKCKEEIARLQALSGQEFDREFAKGAIEGHAMAAAHLQQATSAATDTDVRQYTQSLLAKVREHQRQGREVAKAVGVDQTTITSLERKAQDSVGGPAAGETSTATESSTSSTDTEKSSESTSDKSSSEKPSDKPLPENK